MSYRATRIVTAVLAWSLAGTAAFAQSNVAELASRRLLLERAEAARNAGDHAAALDAATRAGQIEMSPSVRLFIVEELEHLGRLAEAFGAADLCLREVETNTAARNRDAVRERCRAMQAGLRARVGQVVVSVPSPAPAQLRVVIGGAALNPALFGVPMIVTPGDVEVAATAAARVPWRTTVRVVAGATVPVRVELPEAAVEAPPVAVAAPDTPSRPIPPQATAPAPASHGGTQRALAWSRAGGAVLFVGGGVAAVLVERGATNFLLDATNNCRGTRDALTGTCRDHANTEGLGQALAIAGFVTGGVLAATSVVLFLTAPRSRAAVASRVLCGLATGMTGAECAWRF